MILDNEKSFESVVEIYGGFPLKPDFLDVGNAALKERDLKAKYEDGLICIPFICRPYYTPDELDDWRAEGCTEEEIRDMKRAVFHVDLLIEAKDPSKGTISPGFAPGRSGVSISKTTWQPSSKIR